MRKLSLLLSLLLFPCLVQAQGALRRSEARSVSGPAIPGAQIYVCTSTAPLSPAPCQSNGGTEASIYSDFGLSVPITQPVVADGYGNFQYYASAGSYVESVTGPGVVSVSYPVMLAGVGTGCSATGTVGSLLYNNSGTCGPSNLIYNGTGVFCKNFENIRCVDAANSASWPGSTADAWITAAIANLPAGGGTVYVAAGSYTISNTVLVGTSSGPPIKVICDYGCSFIPGNTSVNMFQIAPTGQLIGANINVTSVGGYSGNAIEFTGFAYDNQPGDLSSSNGPTQLQDIVINGNGNTTGTGIFFNAPDTSHFIQFLRAMNATITGMEYGVLADVASNSWFNANSFYNLQITNSVYGIKIHTDSSASTAANHNQFFNYNYEFACNCTAVGVDGIWLNGPHIAGNRFVGGNIWDAGGSDLQVLIDDASSVNYFEMPLATAFVSDAGGNFGSLIKDDGSNFRGGGVGFHMKDGIYDQNDTLATSSSNASSPFLYMLGNCWNGSSSRGDYWTLQNTITGGLQFLHTNPCSKPSFLSTPIVIANQASVCTNAELTLSVGWGTSPTVTAVAGTGQTCEWTITSGTGTPTANPTITDTLTNSLPSSATVCTATLIATGTPATTPVDQTTLSATAPVFTAYFTPATSTPYKYTRKCGP